jgi:hypothetical protein
VLLFELEEAINGAGTVEPSQRVQAHRKSKSVKLKKAVGTRFLGR